MRAITIPPDGTHVAVTAFINGQMANVLIDTGASQTVLDRNRVHIFSDQTEFEKSEQTSKGLGTDGMETHRFTITQFLLGDLLLEEMEVTLLDLSHVNGSYTALKLAPIDMVLGGDMLQRHGALVDYRAMELKLEI